MAPGITGTSPCIGPNLGFILLSTSTPGWAIDRHRCQVASSLGVPRGQRDGYVSLARAGPNRSCLMRGSRSMAAHRTVSHRSPARCRGVFGRLCKRYLANVCDSLLHTRQSCQHPCLGQAPGSALSRDRGPLLEPSWVCRQATVPACAGSQSVFQGPIAGGERCLRAVPGRSPRLRQRC